MAREKEEIKEKEKPKEKAKKEKVKEEVSHLAVKLEIQDVTILAVNATMLEIA